MDSQRLRLSRKRSWVREESGPGYALKRPISPSDEEINNVFFEKNLENAEAVRTLIITHHYWR